MKGPWRKDEDREAMVQARLIRARQLMLKSGVKPLVRSEQDRTNVGLKPAWQRIEIMGEPDKPTTVVPIGKRKTR